MSKIDTVTIEQARIWVDIDPINVKEITVCNTGGVTTNFDFAVGPSSKAGGGNDDGCVYFLKDVKILINSTLVLDEDFMSNTFSSGMTIFTNAISGGKTTRTQMTSPTFLVRLGDTSADEAVDMIILRR
jgi:hypothetical protein